MGRLIWKLRQWQRHVGVRVASYGVLGLVTALAGVGLGRIWPEHRLLGIDIDQVAVERLLSILSNSMLAVTTFSLSIMAAAYASASSTATPRAFQLLKNDPTAQRVLSTFLGAFIFGIVGQIALSVGAYGPVGRVALFGVTILVLGLVVASLIRWIGQLTDFGRMADTLSRLEQAATKAMAARVAQPFLGGVPLRDLSNPTGLAVTCDRAGIVSYIDMQALETLAKENDLTITIAALPGAFSHGSAPLAYVAGDTAKDLRGKVRQAFVVDDDRTFEQDPRFGLIALAEVASRALSPAVNDPGTAIDVLARQLRVLLIWKDAEDEAKIDYPHVHVPGLTPDDLLHDAFASIARDGAGTVEVQLRLQEVLAALAQESPQQFGPAAAHQSDRAMGHAEHGLALEEDRALLAEQAAKVFGAGRSARPAMI